MKTVLSHIFAGSLLAFGSFAAEVKLEHVPENGVQPQVVQGANGTLHLVYLKGEARGCDVRYAQRKPGSSEWSHPITVNSQPLSAIAMGTIRGAQLALGTNDTVHVVWNGPGGKDSPSPLNYAHSVGAGFSSQRDVRGDTTALDGGASIAADARGGVFIVWHGAKRDATPGEQNRVVFVLRSADEGETFSAATMANVDYAGVCACCSLKSFVTPAGELMILYRAARRADERDVTLLRSRDGGQSFEHHTVGTWAISACPMSSMTMLRTRESVRGVWESEGAIETALLDDKSSAQTLGKGRHPALATNAAGETLVAWSVGTGWQRGGSLRWQLLDAAGKPSGSPGDAKGVPVWGFSAVFANGQDFVVLY